MSQLKQTQKVKLFHILKVVFYLLGLPLFFIAVLFTAIKFIGVEPFVGLSDSTFASGVFVGYERFITSPALYGIWCAFAIWAFITICHFVIAKFVKNGKLRMLSVVAIILVVMLGTMGIMDAAFESQIGKIADGAPAGVTVEDYNYQLSHFDYVSYGRKDKSLTDQLIKKVARYEDIYNIKWQGIDKSGEAGNIANKPVTYANVIADDGTVGAKPAEGKTADSLIEVRPNKNGRLVLEPLEGNEQGTYTHYYYITRTAANGTTCYVWYDTNMLPESYKWDSKGGKITPELQDGIYGKGLYNENGLLSDGWIFSFENMLEILEDYYGGQEFLTANKVTDAEKAAIRETAAALREEYYTTGDAYETVKALYTQEADFENRFGITEEKLDWLVSQLGATIGKNSLFDWLLDEEGTVNELLGTLGGLLSKDNPDVIANLITNLKAGTSLNGLLTAFGQGELATQIADILGVTTVGIKLGYTEGGYLTLGLYDGEVCTKAIVEFNFTDQDVENAFTLDALSTFLNTVLNAVSAKLGLQGILPTVGGLVFTDVTVNGETYKGIDLLGTTIPLLNSKNEFAIDLKPTLVGVLQGFYSYQSPVIKPAREFYVEAAKEIWAGADNEAYYIEVAENLANYERALYEGSVVGGIIGSTLIGDTLGSGTYNAAAGLTDLASVQQLKTDLSYQPKTFPLFAFRNMLLTFAGIVMFFYFLSFVAAEKERKYLALENGESIETESAAAPANTNSICGKLGALLTTKGKKASQGRTIGAYVLYGLAFLPLLIATIVLAAQTTSILPAYGGLAFLGFYLVLVFAAIFAVVVAMLHRKNAKAKTTKIAITFVCLTALIGLLFTYVLPDPIADATSHTLYAEDIYNDPIAQVNENASLEHQFVMNNLLNGNLNKYATQEGGGVALAKDGDYSYLGLKKLLEEDSELAKKYNAYLEKFGDFDQLKASDAVIKTLDETPLELYNYIYNNYVLRDYDYAFKTTEAGVSARRAVALAMVDYLYEHADAGKLIHDGFKNKKIKQIFDNNYDSFNQDGYKTFDDPLLLLAQLDGRMTMPVIIRLILNSGWTYTQPTENEGKVTYGGDAFLYEMYDAEAVATFGEAGGAFDQDGKLTGADGKEYAVKYGVDENGWQYYENGVVRRPLNWLVLDMLGDPMNLASIDFNDTQVSGVSLNTIIDLIEGTGVFDAAGSFLSDDVQQLVTNLTGAGLRVSAYVDDAGVMQLQLLPMNTEYAMLGYMQATWVQSNGLLMAVINLMGLRNYLYLFAAIGLIFILAAGYVMDVEEKCKAETAEATE